MGLLYCRFLGKEYMKIVTHQEIINWVNTQPANRPVTMMENYSRCPIGCVMVQYGKEVLEEKSFGCGFFCWEKDNRDGIRFATIEKDTNIYDVLSPLDMSAQYKIRGAKTFGEIQQLINTTER